MCQAGIYKTQKTQTSKKKTLFGTAEIFFAAIITDWFIQAKRCWAALQWHPHENIEPPKLFLSDMNIFLILEVSVLKEQNKMNLVLEKIIAAKTAKWLGASLPA